jgi:hypothetical protein
MTGKKGRGADGVEPSRTTARDQVIYLIAITLVFGDARDSAVFGGTATAPPSRDHQHAGPRTNATFGHRFAKRSFGRRASIRCTRLGAPDRH